MKKKFVLLLALCLLFAINNVAFAEETMLVTLEEPDVKSLVKGTDVTYKLHVKFTESLDSYNNSFINLRLSEGLDYKDSFLSGVEEVPGILEIQANPNKEGRVSFIGIRVTDTKALKGAKEFTANLVLKVNDKKSDGETVLNRVVASYQMKNQIGDAKGKYYQIDQESTAKISSTAPAEDPKPIEQPKPTEVRDQVISVKTGWIYSYFMPDIEGKTNPGYKVQVKYDDKVEIIEVDASGKFKVNIPVGLESDITISSIDPTSNIFMIIKYVDENNITKEALAETVRFMRDFGYEKIVNQILEGFKSYVDQMGIIIGVEGGTAQDHFNLFKELYFATRDNKAPIVRNHERFMNGYPEGNFLPKNSITRAETAAILSRIIAGGEVDEKASNFPDVPNGKWYTKYIAHLTEEGIMRGYEDGKFMPQNKITRAEFATIIARYKKLTEYELINFPPDLDMNHWAVQDIMKVAKAGIMEGYPDKTFGHKINVTRAEAATIINRSLGRIPDKDYIEKNNITGFSDIKNHWAYHQIVEATYNHKYIIENNVEKHQK